MKARILVSYARGIDHPSFRLRCECGELGPEVDQLAKVEPTCKACQERDLALLKSRPS